VLRDHFYVADRRRPWEKQKTFYEILRVSASASPAELRLGFKLREAELHAEGAPKTDVAAAERAFNILACPELRACYSNLLANPLAPALFPYGGFGSVVAWGDRSRDGQTFFVRQIVSFLPGSAQRRFHAPLRSVDFYDDHAIYRDPRRKLEVWLDQSAMPVVWDAT
jgi:DnaJ-class molecular chaperone